MEKKSVLDQWIKYEKVIIPFFTFCFIGLSYFLADFINLYLMERYGRFVHLETKADAYIPFLPEFVFAYITYYFYPFLIMVVVRKRETLYLGALSFIILQILAPISFILIPSKMIRPAVEAGIGIEFDLVRFIYSIDSGFNLLPSLHVAHTTLVTLMYFYTRHAWRYGVAVITFLICCSTVLIKQHYFIDIPFGLLFAFGSFTGGLSLAKILEKPLHLEEGAFRLRNIERG
jgi:membrane-associated phospholipid phosphatase